MNINWKEIKGRLVAAAKWIGGLLALIAMYRYATKASREKAKAGRAHGKYIEAATDTIDERWAEADKHQRVHRSAQIKAQAAKDNARKVRDAVTSEDSTLDDLFSEYRTNRVPDDDPQPT